MFVFEVQICPNAYNSYELSTEEVKAETRIEAAEKVMRNMGRKGAKMCGYHLEGSWSVVFFRHNNREFYVKVREQ